MNSPNIKNADATGPNGTYAILENGTYSYFDKNNNQLPDNTDFANLPPDNVIPYSSESTALTHKDTYEPKPKNTTPEMYYKSENGMREVPKIMQGVFGFGAGVENAAYNLGDMIGMVSPERTKEILEKNEPFTSGPVRGIPAFVGENLAISGISNPLVKILGKGMAFTGANKPLIKSILEGSIGGAAGAGPEDRGSGAVFGAGTNLVGRAIPYAYKAASRGLDPTGGPLLLAEKGADLTAGQLKPNSKWSRLEEIARKFPVFGPRLANAQQQGYATAQATLFQEAAPPTIKIQKGKYTVLDPLPITPKSDSNEMFADIYKSYEPAYEEFKGFPFRPIIMNLGKNEEFANILKIKPNAIADKASINYANKFITNLYSDFEKIKNPKSEDLLKLRSGVRKEIRSLSNKPNAPFKAKDLLETVEVKLTNSLESQLPPDVTAALKAVDTQYGKLKIIEDALVKAKDTNLGFSPTLLASSIEQATPNTRTYASGGGKLRESSKAIAQTFPEGIPKPATSGSIELSRLEQLPMFAANLVPSFGQGSSSGSKYVRQLQAGMNPIQKRILEIEKTFKRKLSEEERNSLVSVLQTGLGNYGGKNKPFFVSENE